MRRIDLIVIHCAATPPDMDIGVREIDRWHKGRGWSGCGYHHVIRRDGTVERGRPEAQVGAHAQGHNAHSIGVCLVGGVRRQNGKLIAEDNFTPDQWVALRNLVQQLRAKYPGAKIVGHRDLDQRKECPSFDVRTWLVNAGLHEGIEWDSGAAVDPPRPVYATKTAAGAITTGTAGLAALADIDDAPQQVVQAAQQASMWAQPGTWFALVLGVLIVGGVAWTIYGRWHARRRSGV